MAGGKATHTADFYCTKCGKKGMPLARRKSNVKEKGHMKKLWCLHCKEEVNHVEIRPFDYNYEEIMEKYKNELVMVEDMPEILSAAMGNKAYTAKFKSEEEAIEFAAFVTKP